MTKKIFLILALVLSFGTSQAGGLSDAISNKMDYLIARQNVISSNIANSSTPGYIAQDINFKQVSAGSGLKMRTTSSKHIPLGRSYSRYEKTSDKTFIRNDGNSVRLDEQMLKLAKVQQEYNLATKLYAKHMGMQKLVVQR